MRFCSPSAVRSLTFLTLVVLSSHSFVFVNAASSDSLTPSPAPEPTPSPSPPPSVTSPPPQSSSEEPEPSITPSVPAPGPSASLSSSSKSSSTPASSSTSTPSEDTASSSPSSSSSSSSLSSSASTPSSSSISPSPSSSASPASVAPPSNTLVGAPVNTHFSEYSYTGHLTAPTSSATPSGTPEGAAAGTSFSHNKGAVAAVATIASLIGVSILGYVAFKLLKRRYRLRDEEDDVYFEKYQEQDPPFHSAGGGGGVNDSSYNIASATQPAMTNAYPDRSMHFGTSNQETYADPQQYGMQYPPGTAYAAAAYGAPYQYQGEDGGYGAAASPANHPYAHPVNTNRSAAAPRVSPAFGQNPSDSHESAYAT